MGRKNRGDLQRLADELDMPAPDFAQVERWLSSLRKNDHLALLHVFEKHLEAPEHGLGVLHKAARAGSKASVKAFHTAGGDINLASALGWTALHYACEAGQSDMVKMLLQLGADVSKITLGGTTALHLASQGLGDEWHACVLAFLRHAPGYVMVDQEDSNRWTAMRMTKSPLVRWLLDYYKEFPSFRHREDEGAWSSTSLLAALSREQERQFGADLRRILLPQCPGCESAMAFAAALPQMPMTVVAQTRSFLPSCAGPSACSRASSMPRLPGPGRW